MAWLEPLVAILVITEAVLIAIAIQPQFGRVMNQLVRLISRG